MAFWRKTTVEKEALPEHIPIVAVRELGNVHKAPYEPEGYAFRPKGERLGPAELADDAVGGKAENPLQGKASSLLSVKKKTHVAGQHGLSKNEADANSPIAEKKILFVVKKGSS
eukprot:TRINITY_DN5371_c0_g1_i1.p1 TRINITY_DN5371_c0_g1~~TRINITY_DN5371_c0_g1_i1.p1  ORF type:complete len:114 (-),score=22.20 TRINITY_DN5371_c0_g1_i1:57-398(-)